MMPPVGDEAKSEKILYVKVRLPLWNQLHAEAKKNGRKLRAQIEQILAERYEKAK